MDSAIVFNARTPKSHDAARQSRNRTARSVWNARSLLPLSNRPTPHNRTSLSLAALNPRHDRDLQPRNNQVATKVVTTWLLHHILTLPPRYQHARGRRALRQAGRDRALGLPTELAWDIRVGGERLSFWHPRSEMERRGTTGATQGCKDCVNVNAMRKVRVITDYPGGKAVFLAETGPNPWQAPGSCVPGIQWGRGLGRP